MAVEIELGTKHECPSCSTKYYDLGKSEAPCPKCGTSQAGAEGEADESKGSAKKSKKS